LTCSSGGGPCCSRTCATQRRSGRRPRVGCAGSRSASTPLSQAARRCIARLRPRDGQWRAHVAEEDDLLVFSADGSSSSAEEDLGGQGLWL
jgi:hypothetical protein